MVDAQQRLFLVTICFTGLARKPFGWELLRERSPESRRIRKVTIKSFNEKKLDQYTSPTILLLSLENFL